MHIEQQRAAALDKLAAELPAGITLDDAAMTRVLRIQARATRRECERTMQTPKRVDGVQDRLCDVPGIDQSSGQVELF